MCAAAILTYLAILYHLSCSTYLSAGLLEEENAGAALTVEGCKHADWMLLELWALPDASHMGAASTEYCTIPQYCQGTH